MSDLFVFCCQKCNIGKLIFYAGGEYKMLHRQFFDGDILQNSFLNKKSSFSFFFFFSFFFLFFFHKNKVEGSEIVGLKSFLRIARQT